jgi:hypothetical protein
VLGLDRLYRRRGRRWSSGLGGNGYPGLCCLGDRDVHGLVGAGVLDLASVGIKRLSPS